MPGYAQDLVEARVRSSGTAAGSPGGIDPRVRVWFNPTIESRYFMLPGIFALLLLVVTSNLSSMAVVREREIGTLEQLNVTPLGRMQLIFGKLLPYAVIGMIDAVIVLTVIVFWFHVPLRGSFWLLIAMSLVYLLTTLGLGPVHLDHLQHPAAGDDDVDVLLHDADDVPCPASSFPSRTCRPGFSR